MRSARTASPHPRTRPAVSNHPAHGLDAWFHPRRPDPEQIDPFGDRNGARARCSGRNRRLGSTEGERREREPRSRDQERDRRRRGPAGRESRRWSLGPRFAGLDVAPQVRSPRPRERREAVAKLRHRRRPRSSRSRRRPRIRCTRTAAGVEPMIRATSFAGCPMASWRTTAARCFSDRAASATTRSRAGSSISYDTDRPPPSLASVDPSARPRRPGTPPARPNAPGPGPPPRGEGPGRTPPPPHRSPPPGRPRTRAPPATSRSPAPGTGARSVPKRETSAGA